VCAAPDYLARHGTPQQPADLARHNCLLMRFAAGVDHEWSFQEDGRRTVQRVRGNRIANDGHQVRQWCLQGLGIALKSEWDVHADLQAGRLQVLLQAYEPPPSALQLLYVGGPAAMPRRVRALVDALVRDFASVAPAVRDQSPPGKS
jgi:DNA-binding transcriptional LysR family regulator